MVTTSADSTIILWDLSGARSFAPTFAGSTGVGMGTIVMSARGKVATISNHTIHFWDSGSRTSASSAVLRKYPRCHRRRLDSRRWHAGARHDRRHGAAVGCRSPHADVDASRRARHAGNRVGFSPDGSTVAVCLWERNGSQVAFYDARTHAALGAPVAVLDDVGSVTWSPDGRSVAIGTWGNDGTDLVEMATHRVRRTPRWATSRKPGRRTAAPWR